jgi:predicted nucleotide-binding protein
MRSAVPQLHARIDDLKVFDVTTVQSGSDPAVKGLEARIEQTIARIFGPDSHEYNQLKQNRAWRLDRTIYIAKLDGSRPPPSQIWAGIEKGRASAAALLDETAKSLTEALEYLPPEPARYDAAQTHMPTAMGDVFIVHGQDKQAKTEVQLFLQKAGLHPVVLHEQPNAGKTIIEKFEDHASAAGFAVVLLTPDDIGGPALSGASQLRPRARQNVVLELGWFAGRLSRSRVCALKKGDIEVPSDIAGVIYVDMDERGAWKAELLRELSSAGYEPDWPKAMA